MCQSFSKQANRHVRLKARIMFALLTALTAVAGCVRAPGPTGSVESLSPSDVELDQATDETFAADVLQHPGPVVVLMGTSWCPECSKAKPLLQQLASELASEVRFRVVDVEENVFLARKYEVSQYPTFLIFLNGQEEQRLVGTRELATMKARLEELLAPTRHREPS